MEKQEYQKLVKDTTPKVNKLGNMITAFLCGGILGTFCEIIRLLLINYYNVKVSDAGSIICFLIITITCFLTAFFDFDKLVIKFKAGLIVPTTGFAHSIQSCAMDYKKDGLITGVGANFFKLAGSVILYGMVSAFVFCILKVLFHG